MENYTELILFLFFSVRVLVYTQMIESVLLWFHYSVLLNQRLLFHSIPQDKMNTGRRSQLNSLNTTGSNNQSNSDVAQRTTSMQPAPNQSDPVSQTTPGNNAPGNSSLQQRSLHLSQ